MKRLLSLCVALVATIWLWAGNVITYTAEEKLVETTNNSSGGLHTNAFNVEIYSHTFINGIGTISFYDDIMEIGHAAFFGCSNLTSITIPNSVTSIGDEAFWQCSSLTEINIPEGVASIGQAAFFDCSNLLAINIPDGVTSIAGSVFAGCSRLSSIIIPETVASIGSGAFARCSSLISIVIPDGVGLIEYEAFFACSSLTEINIPDGVTTIGNRTFYNCTNLLSINIPNGVTSIGDQAFESCSSLTSINIPNGVTSIGDGVFESCSSLTSINIPNGVTSIGDRAFWACSVLTSINIPNGVTSIGERAFQNCSRLTDIIIPSSVLMIGRYAFAGCSGLSSIAVMEGNSRYDSRNDCNAIIESSTNTLISGCQNTIIPQNVVSIGDAAFLSCSGLTSITLPERVTNIGNSAFCGCSNLTSINIPKGVTMIGDWAFAHCSSITSIIIPQNVTSIGECAFYDSNIISITCKTIIPPIVAQNTFPLYTWIDVTVPTGCSSAYQIAQNWSEYSYMTFYETDFEYTRDVTSGNYGTICLPKAVAHEDIQGGVFFKIVYAVTNTNDEVTGILMEEETEGLEAGKPYIFRATADELVLPYSGAAVANPVATNGLVGNLSETPLDVPQDMYVLSNNQIRKLAGGTATAGQNRAYIDLTNVTKLNYVPAAAPNRIVIDVEGSNPIATDLLNVKSEYIQKVIRDGQVLILRDGKTYNVLGKTL